MFGRDAINLLVTDLQTTVSPISPAPVVAPGWPTIDSLLANVAKAGGISISIYDRGPSKDASRFMLYSANEVIVQALTTSALSQPRLPALGTATITIGGAPVAGDAVSLVATNGFTVAAAVTAGATTGETPAQVASALAAAINAEATLNTWISAAANAAVVTLTSLVNAVLPLSSATGNIGTRYTEVDRKVRSVQVDVWAPSDVVRTAVGRLIDGRLAYLDAHFGLKGVGGTTDDGTWVRCRNLSDQFIDTDVYRDLYRWMWIESLEYGQTYAESLYSVLAFEPSIAIQGPIGVPTLL
jgi:hypothetical protein